MELTELIKLLDHKIEFYKRLAKSIYKNNSLRIFYLGEEKALKDLRNIISNQLEDEENLEEAEALAEAMREEDDILDGYDY